MLFRVVRDLKFYIIIIIISIIILYYSITTEYLQHHIL